MTWAEEIKWHEAEADRLISDADGHRWEAARLIVARLDSGATQRAVAEKIGKGQPHVCYMAKVWRDHHGDQERSSFDSLYQETKGGRRDPVLKKDATAADVVAALSKDESLSEGVLGGLLKAKRAPRKSKERPPLPEPASRLNIALLSAIGAIKEANESPDEWTDLCSSALSQIMDGIDELTERHGVHDANRSHAELGSDVQKESAKQYRLHSV